jgi:dipeptidyl aminopeptidase/acylaminoacyl peptidase
MFGASYGGYAALIQGARHPELYRCVVSWAGIADLPRLLRWERDTDGAKGEIYTYDLRQIGDPGKDRDRLTRDSPITYAATYGPPVLLVHGADDTTVPVDQSREMSKALEHAGRDVKLVVVAGENHRDWDDADMEKSLDLVADFLRAHIAPAAP